MSVKRAGRKLSNGCVRDSLKAISSQNSGAQPGLDRMTEEHLISEARIPSYFNRMKTDLIKIGLGTLLLIALTGCFGGYVDGGGGGAVVVAGPEVGFFGGPYDRGRDVHAYSNRGAGSRGVAHGGGGGRAGGRR
jgi:hypothetical protein